MLEIRRLIAEIYRAATGRVRKKGADGEYVCSDPFPIDRGILQGDIMSPVLYILGMAVVLLATSFEKEGMLMSEELTADGLEYADDALFAFVMAMKALQTEEEEDKEEGEEEAAAAAAEPEPEEE